MRRVSTAPAGELDVEEFMTLIERYGDVPA